MRLRTSTLGTNSVSWANTPQGEGEVGREGGKEGGKGEEGMIDTEREGETVPSQKTYALTLPPSLPSSHPPSSPPGASMASSHGELRQ